MHNTFGISLVPLLIAAAIGNAKAEECTVVAPAVAAIGERSPVQTITNVEATLLWANKRPGRAPTTMAIRVAVDGMAASAGWTDVSLELSGDYDEDADMLTLVLMGRPPVSTAGTESSVHVSRAVTVPGSAEVIRIVGLSNCLETDVEWRSQSKERARIEMDGGKAPGSGIITPPTP
jgi:hypothetical protein